MAISIQTILAWAVLVLALDLAVALVTWRVARRRVSAAGIVTGCNLLLGLVPPLNLLVLALLAMLPPARRADRA